MPSIRELRSALGAFAEDKNDEQLLQLASTAMGVSPGRIASEYGYKPTSSGIAGLRTGASIDQYQAGLYGLGEAVTGADFFRRGRQANEFESNVALERARAQGAIGSFEEVQGLSDVPSYLGGLAIGSAPYALEALGGGLAARGLMTGTRAALGTANVAGDAAAAAQATRTLRAGQTAGGVAAAYPSAVGGILQAQREQSGETNLGSAAALGVPFAALNALGIEGALARQQLARSGISALDNMQGFSGGLARAGATGLRTGLVEGGTETLQEMTTQFGRMAVDPNEAFLSDAALGRYKESAIGGALLGGAFGGATGFGRSEGYRAPMGESDLTQPLDTTTRPDPSQFVTQDQTVGLKKFIDVNTGVERPSRKDYAKQFEAAFNEPSGQFVADATTGVERELTVGESMQRGSTAMDLTGANPADTAAAALAATKVATTRDPRDVFLRDELKVIPNNNSRQLFTLMEAQGLDPASPSMVPVWNYAAAKYMTPSRLTKATELMDAAIIQSRKEAPIGTPVSTVRQPAGGVGVGGPIVSGGVGDAGRVAPVAGTVDGGAAGVGAPLRETSLLPVAAGQPAPAVTTGAQLAPQAPQAIQAAPQRQEPTTRGAAGTTALVDTSDDALEIARATGNAAEIEAMREDEAGLRADQRDFTEDDLNAVIEEQLGKGKNADRDRQILRAYITARRAVPSGYKGNIAKEIADSFGIAESRVRQIGNPEKLADVAVSMGFDRAQVFDRLGIQSAQKALATELGKLEGELSRLKGKAKPTKAEVARMSELDEQITRINDEVESGDMTAAFKEAGIEGEAGEAFGNLDDAREWQKASTAGSQMATKLVSIADTIDELKTAAAELQQLGLAQAEAAATERINELAAEYEALVAGYEAKPEAAAPKKAKGKAKSEAVEKAAEEKDAAKEAEAAKFRAERAAKLQADRKGLAVGDTVMNPKLGTGVVKSFAGDGDATTVTVAFQSGQTKELSVKLAKLEKTDAVQVESPTRVSVQPEAEAGQGVGTKVRRAKKPAAEGKAQVPAVILTQAEQAAQAWDVVAADFPEAPKFAELSKAQQQNFIGFGPDNWTKTDVETELTKLARAAAKPTQKAITREPITIDVESRGIDDKINTQLAALPAPQIERLEQHYGEKRGTAEFLAKVQEDIVTYVNKGAEAVAGAIRSIIKTMAEGVLAIGVILNPAAFNNNFDFNLPQTYKTAVTTQVKAVVPANAKAKMSTLAQSVYESMAPTAMASGKGFIIADKPNGMLHVFKADGSVLVQDTALYGKDIGDIESKLSSLKGGAKITPAGKFTLLAMPDAEYAGGVVLGLAETSSTGNGLIAVHAAYLGNAKEKRAERLATPGAEGKRISYGCVNTSHDTFLKSILPNIDSLNGGMIFVLPDAQTATAAMFPAETRTEIRTDVGKTVKTAAVDRTVVGKEQEEVTKAALPKLRALRTVTTNDVDGVSVELQEQELSRIETVPGVGAATNRLRNEGLGNLVDYVGGWYVTDSKVNWDGAFTAIDGQAAVLLRREALTDSQRVEWTTYHEVGHAADQTHLEGGGVFSGLPAFNVRLQNNQIKPMGEVMKAAFDHYNNEPTSDLSKHLAYPFDRAVHGDLDGSGIREELFAQLWATYTTRDGREFLEDNLPVVADFMEQVYEQVKQTDYAAAKADETQRAAQAGGQAPQGNGQPRQVPLRQTTVRFRANRPPQGLIDRNIAKLPKMSQQPVKRLTETLGDLGGAGLDYLVFTSDLVKRAVVAGLPAAQTFSDRLAARSAKVSEEERKIEKIADRYASIEDKNKGDGPGSVNEFLFESTRMGKWGYGKFRDAGMGAAFDALGPKAQQFVKDVFAHGDSTLSNKKTVVLNATNSEYDAMIKAAQDSGDTKTEATLKAEKAATLKRFQTLFRIREGMPYAPIKRAGSYVVIGESDEYRKAKADKDTVAIKKLESDPDHYHVSFTDTKWQARNLRDKLAEQGVFTDPQVVSRSESFDEAFSGEAMLPALTKMRAAVDRRAQDANGKKDPTAGKLLNIINQLYLEALAEGSARKSEMRRRGVAGEVDMLQSFTQQGRADANFLASVEFEPKIQESLQQMRNQSRTGDRERKSEIFDELTKRYAGTLDPQPSPFINGLTSMASKFFLATSPAYYLQNLTQPFMMSLPAMAGRHDYTKAAAELAKAYAELGPLFKDVKLFDEQFDFSKVPADVRAAINNLVNQGKIDIGLATEINEYKVEADSKLSQFAQRLNKGMRMAVQKTEAVNRLSTAIAAYRLEFAKTKDADKATQYAADILTDTHGDYTAFNAPRAFNTQWGKVALQFRKFQLIQIAFYTKLIRDAFTKPDERAAALKTLAYSLSHTAVFAGMMGLPGYAAISAILGFFGDEDEPYDLTADMRKALGPTWADMIMRGVPTVTGMDLSGKIGAGNMLSIMPFSDADLNTNAGRAEALGTLMGGAALGMTSRVIDGLGLIASGDYYKGIERTMPKGVSDALKAGRQAGEGMTRRNGDVILPDSEIGAIDTVLTAFGVPAVQQAVTYERQNRMRDVTKNFTERTTRIKNDYAKAVRERDTGAMAEARAAWTKLQQARQRNGLTPQPVSNLLKAPQEQKAREQRTVGGVAYREGQRKLAESIVGD
jgi:hypothetical protein